MAELLPGPTLADLPDELLENIFSQLHQKRARVGRSRRLRVARHAEANDSCQMPLESRPSEKVHCIRAGQRYHYLLKLCLVNEPALLHVTAESLLG